MTQYIVFLRGINVGGRTIKMADLRTAFESWGFQMVKTVLQTGNVTFESNATDSKRLKQQIEKRLTETFKYPAKVQIFTAEQLHNIIDKYPFEPTAEHHCYIVFLEDDLAKQLMAEVKGIDADTEVIKLGEGVIYWRVVKGQTVKSHFAKFLTKPAYKEFNTNRNLNTLQKLL